MIYVCEVQIECNRLSNWITHYHTEKHKENMKNATHTCVNCCSTFIYKKNEKSKKTFENHIKECKKNVFDEVMKVIDIEEIREENNKLKKEIGTVEKLKEENINLKKEIKTLEKLKEENNKFKNEVDNIEKFKEDMIKLKNEKTNMMNKVNEENIKLKEEIKYLNKIESEFKDLKNENKILTDKIQQIVLNSNNDIKETKNDIIKICGEQLNFAQTVSKDSNKITSSAMTLLGFLQKQCPNAPPLLEFTNDNYEYTFIFNDDFVYDILYAFDNNTAGEFIGKIINSMFLKENKEDQSMFATDCVRLNYSIKEYINENKNKWTLDKGANKVTKIIINPLLLYFIKELKLHLQKENNKMMLAGTKKSDDYIDSNDDIKQIEYKEESDI